jgi:hypothetical protein
VLGGPVLYDRKVRRRHETASTVRVDPILVAIVAVAVCWLVVQLLLLHMDRWLEWDEAVYFAEANTNLDSVGFGPQ